MIAPLTPRPVLHLHVAVQTEDFDLGREVQALRNHDMAVGANVGASVGANVGANVGAIASFVGTVRQWQAGSDAASQEQALELEHYPGMTEQALLSMAQAAAVRFGALGVRLIHRVGRLPLGDQIVLVVVSAKHRKAAFDCCEFLMDGLKTQAPFWKKEVTAQGERWVDAREQDDQAWARWRVAP